MMYAAPLRVSRLYADARARSQPGSTMKPFTRWPRSRTTLIDPEHTGSATAYFVFVAGVIFGAATFNGKLRLRETRIARSCNVYFFHLPRRSA